MNEEAQYDPDGITISAELQQLLLTLRIVAVQQVRMKRAAEL